MTTTTTLITLALNKLDRDPNQPREEFIAAEINELAASIKEQGLIQPIVVRVNPSKDGHYFVIAGERRFRAAKKAKLTEVPVLVKEGIDVADVRGAQLTENFHRKDLTLLEIATGVDRYIAEEKLKGNNVTNAKLQKMFGRNATYWSRVRKILRAPESLVQAIKASEVTNINVISDLVSLSETDLEAYKQVWAEIEDGAVEGNLENYVSYQLRAAKELKKFGFVVPEANEHGVYPKFVEGNTKQLIFGNADFNFELSVTQIESGKFAVYSSYRHRIGSCSGPCVYAESIESYDHGLVTLLKGAGRYVQRHVDMASPGYVSSARKALSWVHTELEKRGEDEKFALEMPKQSETAPTSETVTKSEERCSTATVASETVEQDQQHEERCSTATVTTETEEQDAPRNETVVQFKRSEPLSDTIQMAIPTALQPAISRLLSYYYGVESCMGQGYGEKEIECVIKQITGEATSAAVH